MSVWRLPLPKNATGDFGGGWVQRSQVRKLNQRLPAGGEHRVAVDAVQQAKRYVPQHTGRS